RHVACGTHSMSGGGGGGCIGLISTEQPASKTPKRTFFIVRARRARRVRARKPRFHPTIAYSKYSGTYFADVGRMKCRASFRFSVALRLRARQRLVRRARRHGRRFAERRRDRHTLVVMS